jgi:hypothetical protein
MTNDAPGLRQIYEGSIQSGIEIFIVTALMAVAITLWIIFFKDTLRLKYLLLVIWGIIPPVWFVVEYFFIYLPHGVAGSFDFFRYGQDVASKLWAAVFALVSIDLYRAVEKQKEKTKD